MAISETTKREVYARVGELEAHIADIDRDIATHQAAIDQLQVRKAGLLASIDALKKDVPQPTPAPM